MILYHGSNQSDLENIQENEGIFGGIFANQYSEVAESHGEHLYKIEIDEEKLLSDQDLNNNVDFDKVKEILNSELDLNEDNFDEIYSHVIEEKNLFKSNLEESELLEIFAATDLGEASWAAQKIRGAIAKKLGYHAVEMFDEHGTTYLVLNCINITKID